ncbi:MAG: recombinase family protein [Acidobacteriota bacterium]
MPIPAAQYLRMSTEEQPNSIATQRRGIQEYARAHDFEIIATYADPGRSGLDIRNRPGLKTLLRDVLSGNSTFRAILVFDVSRWGRFQNTDESAHYEFLCRRAGIPVHYCAEQFDNDDTFPNAIMKTVKRTMAAEYSRELSRKIAAAQKRMVERGFHTGGFAGYGLRRMLIKTNGCKQVLQAGECKNLRSDRVVLVPGPKQEVECVRTIFKLAAFKENSPRIIAEELNRRKMFYSDRTPWDYLRVFAVLQNQRLIGTTIWGRTDTRFQNPARTRPPADWLVRPGTIPAIVTAEQFATAQKCIKNRSCIPGLSKESILGKLSKMLAEGRPLSRTLNRSFRLYSDMWRRRFGSILKAYELIGYQPSKHQRNSATAYWKIQALRKGFFKELKTIFDSRVRMVRFHGCPQYRVLEVDNRVRVAVYICRNLKPKVSGQLRWKIVIRERYKNLPALLCLPDSDLSRITDLYFVSDFTSANTGYTTLSHDHPWLASENHLHSLGDLGRFTASIGEEHQRNQMQNHAVSLIGDVMCSQDDPTFIVDGNEILLTTPNAAIFRLLLRSAGQVVSRTTLTHAETRQDKDLYLNAQIGELRKALGPQYRKRIVTVRHQGYMYQRDSQSGVP